MKNPSDKDWKSIEIKWREKIHEEISPVPEGLWEKISLHLDEKEKPKVFIIKTWQWVAILAVAIGLGWQWFLPQKEEMVQKTKSMLKAPILTALQIPKVHTSKRIPKEKIKVTYVITQSPEKGSVPVINKTEIAEPTRQDVVIQQSPPPPSNSAEENGEEEVIWVQVKIDPALPADEERPTSIGNATQKKRNLGQFLEKIKKIIKGHPGEWSEIKENFHLVANKYVQTEETIKQTIQYQ